MAAMAAAAAGIADDTVRYWRAFADFALDRAHLESGGSAHLAAADAGDDGADVAARQLHAYSLARTVATWDAPHYRAPSFGADVAANLRNLAVPGTGVSMAWAALHRWVALAFLLVGHPLVALGAAVYEAVVAAAARRKDGAFGSRCLLASLPALASDARARYASLLLDPPHWFALWRLNCALVAEHSRLGCPPGSAGEVQYGLEEKGRFLVAGDAAGVPVTPFLRAPGLVVKHRAIEGGMGIHAYANFTAGGDWILQERLDNDAFLSSLLPPGAPLSTLRVITASRVWLQRQLRGSGDGSGTDALPPVLQQQLGLPDVEVLTTVWRAGRAGAATDHNSVCFAVDGATGAIGPGVSNQHWYRLGRAGAGSVGPTSGRVWRDHPDTGRPVTGAVIPGLPGVLATVAASHRRLLPEVPLVGWDMALTPAGPLILEVNLSCNFFCGGYDRAAYVAFATAHFVALERLRRGVAPLVPPPPPPPSTEAPAVLPALPLAPLVPTDGATVATTAEDKPPPPLTGVASAATLCAEAAPAPATARDRDDSEDEGSDGDGCSGSGGSDDGSTSHSSCAL
jgi:hypothetical protein